MKDFISQGLTMKFSLVVVILTVFSVCVAAQSLELISKAPESEALAVCLVGENLVVGGTLQDENRSAFAFLANLDPSGDTLYWRQTGGTPYQRDRVIDIAIFGNDIVELSEIDESVTLTLLDGTGAEIWHFKDSEMESAAAIAISSDGVVVCGTCESEEYNEGRRAICLSKVGAIGDLEWTRFIGDGNQLKPYGVAPVPDGGWLVNAWRTVEGNKDPHLIWVDDDGTELWSKSVAEYGFDYAFDMKVSKDGNILLAGESAAESVAQLTRLDVEGNLWWSRLYMGAESGNFRAYSVDQSQDGGYILAGRTTEASAFLIKTDKDGMQEWMQIYKGAEKAGFQEVLALANGGFLAVGISLSRAGLNAYLRKTDAEGN